MNFEKVKETMVNTLGCDEEKITMEASIADDLGIDSLMQWSWLWHWKKSSISKFLTKSWAR